MGQAIVQTWSETRTTIGSSSSVRFGHIVRRYLANRTDFTISQEQGAADVAL